MFTQKANRLVTKEERSNNEGEVHAAPSFNPRTVLRAPSGGTHPSGCHDIPALSRRWINCVIKGRGWRGNASRGIEASRGPLIY